MKFFTPEWKKGEIDDDIFDAFAEYKAHFTPLLPRMPSEIQKLATEINLHDGLLWKVLTDAHQASVTLTLRCGDLQVGYFDLEIQYRDVDLSLSLTKNLKVLIVNRISSDLRSVKVRSEALYDEVDIDGDWFVHRILFTSRQVYHEFEIRFQQLHLNMTPREDR